MRVALVLSMCCMLSANAAGQDSTGARQAEWSESIRSLVHILDYLAQDYPDAVSGGQVINADEYDEMVSFGRNAESLVKELLEGGVLPSDAGLVDLTNQLQSGIETKAPADTVASRARAIGRQVLAITDLPTAPLRWPDLTDARFAYETTCAVCHGLAGEGDGRVSGNLDPRPTNFVEGDRIASQSPFQIYNTIRLGVEGTSMPDFQVLSEEELWKLAFFVKSLRYQSQKASTAAFDSVTSDLADVTLERIATLNDEDLARELAKEGAKRPEAAVAALRTGTPNNGNSASLRHARQLLEQALTSYRKGDVRRARRDALHAYLEGVEPVEPMLTTRDATLTATLEGRMLAVRNEIERGADAKSVSEAVEASFDSLDEAEGVLSESPPSPLFSFFLAASILLREGLEAFLIILAILGVLRSVGQKQALRWVHAGWILALGLGVVAWFFSDALIQIGAARREIMEGFIAVFAVGVLVYVGFWLHNKSEITRWREFIERRVKRTIGAGNLFGLASISFFAVFREATESVLFLSALTLEQGTAHRSAVAGGAVAAIAAVILLSAVLLRFSVRVPSRRLFKYSAAAVDVLCVILAGKGIHAFQEAGILSVTPLPLSFRIEVLGMYATLETIATQILLVIILLLLRSIPKYVGLRTAVS